MAAGHTLSLDQSHVNTPLINYGTVQALNWSTIGGSFTNAAGATLHTETYFSIDGGISNQGVIEFSRVDSFNGENWVQWSGTLVNGPTGSITTFPGGGNGPTELQGSFDNQGTLTIRSDTNWQGASFSTSGTVNVAASCLFAVGGTFTNFDVGTSALRGGTFNLAGGMRIPGRYFSYDSPYWIHTLAASLTLDGPNSGIEFYDGSGAWSALPYFNRIEGTGNLTLRNGFNLTTTAVPFINAGTLTIGAGCTFSAFNGITNTGTLAGSGAVSVNHDWVVNSFVSSGTISPGESPGLLTLTGNVIQSGPLAIELNGTNAGEQYDQLKVNGIVSLAGPLDLTVSYGAPVNDTFVIIDNDGTDPVVGTFAGLAEGARLTADGQPFQISYVGGTGNDVVLTRVEPEPPKALSVRIGDGSAQRSRVTSLTVTFDSQLTFAGSVASAFALTRDSDGATVVITSAVYGPGNVVQLSGFTGPATQSGSLANGTYTLTALASQISADGFPLDGNGDGTGGDNYTFVAAQGLYRLFGDANGDGSVNGVDLIAFRPTIGATAGGPNFNAAFDANNDGFINGVDLIQFRNDLGQTVYPTGPVVAPPPPTIAAIAVNDGADQRSEVRSITVTFSGPVMFAADNAAAAFQLTHLSDGNPVGLAAAVSADTLGRTVVRLTFAGAEIDPLSLLNGSKASLADGRYQLTILGGSVIGAGGLALDGAANGTPGGNYVSPTDTLGGGSGELHLYRLFGDANGDGVIDQLDLGQVRRALNTNIGDPFYLSFLDADNSGNIDHVDLGQFRTRFNLSVF